jgi:SIR2-like domain
MYSIFIIGAGFSKAAGYPLGQDLFSDLIKEAKKSVHYENILKPDIEDFIEYKEKTSGVTLKEDEINFEDFVSYLDIEHVLDLRGSDTWSEEGNRSQLLIRNLIAKVFNNCWLGIKKENFEIYEHFASHLEPTDYVLTFNYDTLLERACESQQVAYRLYPMRFESVTNSSGIVQQDTGEVAILKMHGSIDWFDITRYKNNEEYFRHEKIYQRPRNIIFEDYKKFWPTRIIDEPFLQKSGLKNIYRIKDLDAYFQRATLVEEAPLIVSPSFSKLAYLNPLIDFWHGLNQSGGLNKMVTIIGFSLPPYDEYVRQPLYSLISNFQFAETGDLLKKSKLKIVDFKKTAKSIKEFKNNYRFVDWERTSCYFKGFNNEAIDFIFNDNN